MEFCSRQSDPKILSTAFSPCILNSLRLNQTNLCLEVMVMAPDILLAFQKQALSNRKKETKIPFFIYSFSKLSARKQDSLHTRTSVPASQSCTQRQVS